MEEICKNLGISDGFSFPVANAENKALEREIQEKQKQKDLLESKYEDTNDRLKNVFKFTENCNNEVVENQKLLTAFDNQINTEDADVRLLKGHIRTTTADQKSAFKTIKDTQEKEEFLKIENDRALLRVDSLKAYLQWDKAALEAWDDEMNRVSSDAAILEKFAKQDQLELKNLELRRLKLRDEVELKRKKMENLKDDVISLEQGLEKTGLIFQQHHEDRNALVSQWEGSVNLLRQRDEDISRGIEEVGGLRAQAKQHMRDLLELKRFYDNEVRNRKEAEMELDRVTREAVESKALAGKLNSAVTDMQGEYLTLRCSLSRMASFIQEHRSNCRRIADEILKKRQLCHKYQLRMESLREEIQEARVKNMSANERVRHLDDLCTEEQQIQEKMEQERAKLLEVVRGVNEELLRFRSKEKLQKSSMSGLEASLNDTRKRTLAALEEQKRQNEMLYNMEVATMEKEIQFRKIIGSEDVVDKAGKQQQLASISATLAQVQSAHDLIVKERYRLDQEFRRLTTALALDEKELNYYRNKKQELNLLSDGGEKQLLFIRGKNQERQVDDNVLKLRVRQLEKAVNRVGGKLFTLERQKLELDEAVKERSMEVQALMDILNVQKRGVMEQVSSMNAKINLANLKVEHLRKKYDVSISSFGRDESGETQSVEYYKLKAAQERCELQQTGDRLDDRIRKTEKEIQAMENTLKIVNCANRTYKFTLSHVEADGPEMTEKEDLENAYLKAVDDLRRKKSTLQSLNEAATRLEDQLHHQVDLEGRVMREWKDKDLEAADLDKELLEQEEKLSRAAKVLRGYMRNIRSAQHTRFQTLEEKDIELREVMEQNQVALQQLSETVARTVDTGPVVSRYLQEKGLVLPQIHSSHLSSSRRSTASSQSSGSVRRSCLTIDASALEDGKTDILTKFQRKSSTQRAERKLSKSLLLDKRPSTVDITDISLPMAK